MNDRTSSPGPPQVQGGSARSLTRASADVNAQLARLVEMQTPDLRAAWQRLYRAVPPPRLSRDLLTRGIAWKIQEQAYGGLSSSTKRRLRQLAERHAARNGARALSTRVLRPGARLVREWRGQVLTVTVVEDGFEYNGRRWRSLTQIAKAITGVHWSGPRFFGLSRSNGPVASPDRALEPPTDRTGDGP